MIFDGIIGHDEVKSRLQTAVLCDKVSHAYIFAGKRGVGKFTTALAFADALTGGKKSDIIIVNNDRYDVDKKTDGLSVKAVRAASADMFVKPYESDKRVFIIPDAEKMNIQAQNALLKVFEEPPSYCVIILVAQNDNMLLQTIRSRAVTIRFGTVDDDKVGNFLDDDVLNKSVIVRLAAGSIGMAQELSKNEDLDNVFDEFVPMFKDIGKGMATDIYKIIGYLQREKKNYEILFDIILIMLRDTVLGKKSDLFINNIGQKKAVSIIQMVENTRNSFSYNANYDLAVSEMMLNILGAIND